MNDMNEQGNPLDASAAPAQGADAARSGLVSRRRFAKAGAAGSVVLGSLASKPVLAYTNKQIYHCTLSGQLSGNFSTHPDTIDCHSLGRSPGYWKNHTNWPGGLVAGTLPSATCSFTGGTKGTAFNGYTCAAPAATFPDSFRRKAAGSACTIYDVLQGSLYTACSASNKATMLEILNAGGGLNETSLKALGRATVASLLNALAATPANPYPLTPAQVIKMYTAVYKGGTFAVNTTVSWSATQVKTYFESLYDASVI